jgi:hypothetical protein
MTGFHVFKPVSILPMRISPSFLNRNFEDFEDFFEEF